MPKQPHNCIHLKSYKRRVPVTSKTLRGRRCTSPNTEAWGCELFNICTPKAKTDNKQFVFCKSCDKFTEEVKDGKKEINTERGKGGSVKKSNTVPKKKSSYKGRKTTKDIQAKQKDAGS